MAHEADVNAPACPQGDSAQEASSYLQDAFNNGEKEKLLYVPAIVPDQSRPDYLAVIDVDPQSATYQQVETATQKVASLLQSCLNRIAIKEFDPPLLTRAVAASAKVIHRTPMPNKGDELHHSGESRTIYML